MPGRRAILPSAMFTLVFVAALSSQATRSTHAADECLAKPNAATPAGQHWYYRIDHANNNRQCWRLAAEGLPVQKAAPQSDDATLVEPDAEQQPRAPQAAVAVPAQASADPVPATVAAPTAVVAASPWLAAPPLPAFSQTLPQTASADDSVPVATDDTPAAASDAAPTGSVRADRSSRPAPERTPPAAAPQQFAGIDHTFALLMVMFALLAVTGPILHFTHRQRQRDEVVTYKPPRWAPVIALNTPTPRVRVTPVPDPAIAAYRPARRAAPRTDHPEWRPAPNPIPNPQLKPSPVPSPVQSPVQRPVPSPIPIPPRPLEPNERLTHALQQLVDRIQTIQSPAIQSPAIQSPEPRVTQRRVQRATPI